MPRWYPLVRAARWLGVAPWDLAKQPVFWRDAALIAEEAEIAAEADRRRQREEMEERAG